MDSLVSAFFSAQVGRLQLAVAARLARTDPNSPINPDVAPSVTKLVDAAQQNAQPLANAAIDLGTHLDINC
jgi:hypothetical protein